MSLTKFTADRRVGFPHASGEVCKKIPCNFIKLWKALNSLYCIQKQSKMPFTCIFQLNNGAIKNSDNVIFLDFIKESFGEFHEEKIKIARITLNNSPAFIYSNCPCFPSAFGNMQSGQTLTSETKIAYFSANGEDIPYYKPYAIISFD